MPEVVMSVDVNAPIQRVWDELTRRGRNLAMFGNVFHRTLAAGQPFRFSSADDKRTMIYGELLEVEAPRRLAYTFNSPCVPGSEPDTVVTWTLDELRPGATRVTLRHDRFNGESKLYKGVRGGWDGIVRVLKSVSETGAAPLPARIQMRLMGVMFRFMPRHSRTSNIPERFRNIP